MRFGDYCKSKAGVVLLNAAAMLVLSIFLLLLGNTGAVIFLIVIVWSLVLGIFFEENIFRN